MPLSEELTKGVTGLQNHLQTNESNVVNITGYYTSDEENNTAFPNLGLARANNIKNDLASKGISTAQINTMGKLIDDMIAKNGTYWGAASFSIDEESQNTNVDLKALYESINAAEASISLNVTQRQKVDDISRYLDKVNGTKANVLGHTDGTGKASTNMRLGQDRANFAKEYLIKNGIASDIIIATSKGQTEPIESNTIEEGKDKNRRTVITLN
jgi:outer membrane protein OmpA-like peptidoglycan-associated protein